MTVFFSRNSLFYLLQGGKPHQRIPSANIEINVRQWLNAEIGFRSIRINLGSEFEEEPQFADFHCLFHDVHAVKIVEDYAFVNEVLLIWVVCYLLKGM